MGSETKVIQRKKVALVVVPCPRCGSWLTDPMDKKRKWWCCAHFTCMTPFVLEKHYALILLKDGGVIKVDKDHKVKIN